MKEFILALLLAKFVGVRKDGLAQLATAMALQADKEEDATALIEKITPEKVNDFVKDWRKDVDKEVSTSTKTFETTLKEKYDLVEKKGEEKPNPKPESNEVPEWAKAMMEQNKNLADKLAGFQGQEVNKSRLQILEGHLKDVPETFKAQKLKDFNRMSFENEESFAEYLAEFEVDVTALNQELSDKGMSSHARPFMGGANKDGVSSSVADFITSKTDETKVLSGKDL